MGKFILRSKAVFTGLEDFPRPAAIAVVDKKIRQHRTIKAAAPCAGSGRTAAALCGNFVP